MTQEVIFEKLWKEYVKLTPSAKKVKDIFEKQGNTIYNDHIAFRTFDHDIVNIEKMATVFLKAGYQEIGDYHFKKKHLYAKHFEHKTDKNAPRVFISQLKTNELSQKAQDIIKQTIAKIDVDSLDYDQLIFQGRLWGDISYDTYNELLEESEYAAWLYVNGFCSNHFTIDINKLDTFESLEEVNEFLKSNGFTLNSSGGEIKGGAKEFLAQSSIMADKVKVKFDQGSYDITSCYYEFAYRFPMANGELFSGFVAGSADKIFESTNMKK